MIQYILDLNDARFSEPLIRTFVGNVCSLSVQKYVLVSLKASEVERGLMVDFLPTSSKSVSELPIPRSERTLLEKS